MAVLVHTYLQSGSFATKEEDPTEEEIDVQIKICDMGQVNWVDFGQKAPPDFCKELEVFLYFFESAHLPTSTYFDLKLIDMISKYITCVLKTRFHQV